MADLQTSDQTDGVVTLRLSGSLDEADVTPTLRQARELLRPAGTHTLIVDLAEVAFIDSSGLGLLVSLRQLAEDRGAHFALRQVPERVTRLLHLTGLMGYLAAQ
ncbi:STAS domain-containing protein [uncultured Jatrophihabitans sp.]|uniref:STAS domain-containing protein n=1 Tax=uncultured Jatrophihabitans sp. TaxID=1610747 RepID=UPI0035CAF338